MYCSDRGLFVSRLLCSCVAAPRSVLRPLSTCRQTVRPLRRKTATTGRVRKTAHLSPPRFLLPPCLPRATPKWEEQEENKPRLCNLELEEADCLFFDRATSQYLNSGDPSSENIKNMREALQARHRQPLEPLEETLWFCLYDVVVVEIARPLLP